MSVEQVTKFRRTVEKNIAKKKFDEAKRDIGLAIKHVRKKQIHCLICDKQTNSTVVAHDFPSACSCKQKDNNQNMAKEMTCLIYSQGRCDIETAKTADEHLAVVLLFVTHLVPWIAAIKSVKTVQKRQKFASCFLWQRAVCNCLPKALVQPDFAEVSLLAAELALSWEMRGENFKLEPHLCRTGSFFQQLHRICLRTKSAIGNADKFSLRIWHLYKFGVRRCAELMTYQHSGQAKMCCPLAEKPPSLGDDISWAPINVACNICGVPHISTDLWKFVRMCISVLNTLGTHYVNLLQAAPKGVSNATMTRDIIHVGKETGRLVRVFIQGGLR